MECSTGCTAIGTDSCGTCGSNEVPANWMAGADRAVSVRVTHGLLQRVRGDGLRGCDGETISGVPEITQVDVAERQDDLIT